MSSNRPSIGGGYHPAPAPEPQMTVTQYQSLQDFFFGQVERFKRMFESSTLAKYIVMAGISGVVVGVIEVARAIIDLIVYFRK
jgi:hypothetical protein